MAKSSYVIDEGTTDSIPEMKESISVKESDLKGITNNKLGDEVSLSIKGKISQISKGFGKEGPMVRIEIDSIEQGGMENDN